MMGIFGVGVLMFTLPWFWVLLPVDHKIRGKRTAFFIGWQTAPLIGFIFSDTSLSYLLQTVSASVLAYVLVRFTLNTTRFAQWRRQYYAVAQDGL